MSFHFYASFKGQKQGAFNGESVATGRRDKWVDVVAFNFGLERPYDPGSGKSPGARSHQPITVTKEDGPASPQLMRAHWDGEILDEVVIEICGRPTSGQGESGRPSSGAGETVVERITLTNATISRFMPRVGGAIHGGKSVTDFVLNYGIINFGGHGIINFRG
jgi:type VI secretion system Hcp family effector